MNGQTEVKDGALGWTATKISRAMHASVRDGQAEGSDEGQAGCGQQ